MSKEVLASEAEGEVGEETAEGPCFCSFGATVDSENLGVAALATSLVRLVKTAHPDARIFFVFGSRDGGERTARLGERTVLVQKLNFRLSFRSRPHQHLLLVLFAALLYRLLPLRSLRAQIRARIPIIDAIERSRFVGDIRGGDSFSDIYGLRRLVIGIFPSLIAFALGKKLLLMPQTYGPFDSVSGRWLARTVMRRATHVYARDRTSVELARELAGPRRDTRVTFCPDVAFTLEPTAVDERGPFAEIARLEHPLVGLNISGLLYIGGYSGDNMFGLQCDYRSFVEQYLSILIEATDARVVLVPHTLGREPESDSTASREVWNRLSAPERQGVHLVQGTYTASEAKGLIGLCDFFVGSRMHSCIAALSQHVPCVGVAYSRKFSGVFESIGLEELVVDARTLTAEQIVSRCLELYRERHVVRERLEASISQVQERVMRAFREEVLV